MANNKSKRILVMDPLKWKRVLDIIDSKWQRQISSYLFDVAFILSFSTFFYSNIEETNSMHNHGLFEVFKKLIINEEEIDVAYDILYIGTIVQESTINIWGPPCYKVREDEVE